MPSIGLNRDKFIAEMEAAGIEEVRNRLATNTYNIAVGEKGLLATEWLRQKDANSAATAAAEQIAIDRSSKNAAWAAAISAIVAVPISLVAIGLTVWQLLYRVP